MTRRGMALMGAGWLAVAAGLGCASNGREWPCVEFERTALSTEAGAEGLLITTAHYEMRITAQDTALVDYLPPFMETAFTEYTRMIPPAQVPDRKMLVYLFNTRKEWAAFTQHRYPRQAPTYLHIMAGGFTDHTTGAAVTFDITRDKTLSLLAHEGLHQYFIHYFPRPVAPWINEGLATQFEAFDLDGPYPIFTPRRNFIRRNHLREALAIENGLIDLRKLLAMDAGEAVRKTGQSVRSYYAQVWSLTLFLREQWPAQFAALCADLGSSRLDRRVAAYRQSRPDAGEYSDREITFRAYIDQDFEAFQQDYIAYASALVDG